MNITTKVIAAVLPGISKKEKPFTAPPISQVQKLELRLEISSSQG